MKRLASADSTRRLESSSISEIDSAGTGAWDGEQASEGSFLVGLEQGIDLGAHRARPATRDLVTEQDLIFAMASGHLHKLERLGGEGKSHLFGAYAGVPADEDEVGDPVGGPIEGYRAVYAQLERMARAVAARIAKERK